MPRMPVTELSKKIAALEASLNKSPEVKGASVMTDIDLAPNTFFLRRPSGIMQLDVHTGGGLPGGGLTYLSGPDGAGKTFLLYKYIAMNQRLYGDKSAVAIGVAELAPDHFFMRRCGVQIRIPEEMIEERQAERKERGWPAYTKEELAWLRMKTVGTVKILRGAHGDELLGAVLACFDSTVFDIVALDSVSAILPEADSNKDLDQAPKRAASALLLTQFFQHYLNGTTGYYGKNATTTIFTSQVRANAKKAEAQAHIQKFLPDYAPQGAWAAKHGKLIDILIKPGEKDKENVKIIPGQVASFADAEKQKAETKRVQVGKTVKYEVMKGKAGIHEGIAGEFDFNYERLVDDQRTVIVAGIGHGIVYEKNGVVTFFNPADRKPYPDATGMSIDELAQKMRQDFELELKLRRAVLSASGIECAYR